jgi:VWFA-related protein
MNVLSSKALHSGALKPLLSALILSLLAGPAGPGLYPQAPPAKPLQYEVSVSVKLIQVYATGKGGAPVTDLTAADFEVTDNGKVCPVTHFERHFLEAGEALPAAPAAAPAAVAPLNRKFFLIFDFAFMDGPALLRAKSAALKFLDGDLLPSDEIGLVTYYATRGLVLNEYLTTDHARIRSIIDGFGAKPRAGRAENLTQFIYSSEFTTLPPSDKAPPGTVPEVTDEFYDGLVRAQTGAGLDAPGRQNYVEQARQLMVSLGEMAKVLRSVAGFKNIVLFSGGIARQYLYGQRGGAVLGEWQTPEQLAARLKDYDGAQADALLRDEHTAMIKELKASNCPVYAVDVSRQRREGDVVSMTGASGAGLREFEGADSLRQIASGTDGKFYGNTVQEERIADDIRDSTVAYYVLGYSVPETYDGRFHRIKVKVSRKGVDVNAQGGYYSAKPFKDYTKFEKLLHVVDLALSETPEIQIPYDIPVAAQPLTVKGWPQALVFARASRAALADVFGNKAEAYLLLPDEKGDVAAIQRFTLPPAKEGQDALFPSFLVRSKPGRYACRLVIRNLETGRAARGGTDISVPAEKVAVLVLDPPLLVAPETGAAELTSSEGTSVSALFGYDPAAYAPRLGEVAAGTDKLRAGLRVQGGAAAKDLVVSAFLLDLATAARTEVPVTIIRQSDDGPARLIIAELATGELKPGRYALECSAEEPASGEIAVAFREFTVK